MRDRRGGQQPERLAPAERAGRARRLGRPRRCTPQTAPGRRRRAPAAHPVRAGGSSDPRSSSTASHPNATTRPAERIAQVSRQLRATSGATSTGQVQGDRQDAELSVAQPEPGQPGRRRALGCRPIRRAAHRRPATGTPAMRSHPWRPNSDDAHGRLATKREQRGAPTAIATMISADLARSAADQRGDRQHDADRDDEQGERRHEGDSVTAVSAASWHSIRRRARAGHRTRSRRRG